MSLTQALSTALTGLTATQTGIQRLGEGRIDEAIERFEAAIKFDPNYAQAWYRLSVARRRKGQTGAAQEALRKAEELDPKLKRRSK